MPTTSVSSQLSIHSVVSITHFVRKYKTWSNNHIVVTDKDGNETEIVLYSDAPLTIPEPRVYRVGIDHWADVVVAP